MAGDWIKMRADLQTHPKVVRIASALNADKLRVIGGLHAVWCLFDAHSLDGSLDGYTAEALDSLLGCPGFARAMAAVGWLQIGDESLSLPRFDEHNGKGAKRRAAETERKRASRQAESDPQDDRKVSASDADKKRTREEKRREEKKEIPSVPNGTGAAAPLPDSADAIFAMGVPLLVASAVPERNARSMLALMRKTHGDEAVIGALQRCAAEKPLQPVPWLVKALPSKSGPPVSKPDRIAEANIAVVRKFHERTAQ